MSREIRVQILGDSRDLERAFSSGRQGRGEVRIDDAGLGFDALSLPRRPLVAYARASSPKFESGGGAVAGTTGTRGA